MNVTKQVTVFVTYPEGLQIAQSAGCHLFRHLVDIGGLLNPWVVEGI